MSAPVPLVGCTEHELTARIEAAYVAHGGMHHIHYLGITPMAAPDRSVPAQWPSARPVAAGDLLTFELSAAEIAVDDLGAHQLGAGKIDAAQRDAFETQPAEIRALPALLAIEPELVRGQDAPEFLQRDRD